MILCNDLLTAEKLWVVGGVIICIALIAQQLYFHFTTDWDEYFKE